MTEGEKKYLIAFVEFLIRDAKRDSLDQVLEIIDKDIDFYRQLGKPDNQHRDVINAFTDFRRSIVALREGEQE